MNELESHGVLFRSRDLDFFQDLNLLISRSWVLTWNTSLKVFKMKTTILKYSSKDFEKKVNTLRNESQHIEKKSRFANTKVKIFLKKSTCQEPNLQSTAPPPQCCHFKILTFFSIFELSHFKISTFRFWFLSQDLEFSFQDLSFLLKT